MTRGARPRMPGGRPPGEGARNGHSGPPEAAAAATRTMALRLLGRRDYTTAELRARLLDRGCPAPEVHGVIERLTADGLLDDRRVAAAHLRTASRIKGRGAHRIERELLARGIDRSLAADLVSGISVQDETAAIDRVLLRRHLPANPTPEERRKLFQHLLRRGFSSDAIARALGARGHDPD